MNAFSRSWNITKLSFNVINKDRELIWFALLSFIFSALFSIAIIVPSVLPSILDNGLSSDSLAVYQYVLVFVTYLGLAFIATFFNVCVVNTAKIRFEGGNASFGDSFRFAMSRIGLIFQWSLLSATVGLLLKLLDNLASKFGKIGEVIVHIIVGLLGATWSILTIFVVPVLVYEGLGPIDAVKKSAKVIRHTWGESLIKSIGLGLMSFFAYLLIAAIFGGLAYLAATQLGGVALIVIIGIGLGVLLLAAIIFSVASMIFNTALYLYAEEQIVASGFNEDLMRSAFKNRKR